MLEMQEQLIRLKEESNRRIQNDRNDLMSRIELENELKLREQQNRTEIKKSKAPQRIAPKQLVDRLSEIQRPANNNAPRYLNSPNTNKKLPQSILENAQYDNNQANVNVFVAENDLDREVLHIYSNRNVVVDKKTLPFVSFQKGPRDGEYYLGQRKFALYRSPDTGDLCVKIGTKIIPLIDFIEKQEKIEAKKLWALQSAGSLLYLV
jgi:hypothetical protein